MKKDIFLKKLKEFSEKTEYKLSDKNKNWTIKGFIDNNKNIYSLSDDTKLISKVLELHIYPYITEFADRIGYKIELPEYQNYYPDYTFISNENNEIKYAVDLKTTYFTDENKTLCNGFTLGSHGNYFRDRNSLKNIQYPYKNYKGHFCLGIIYKRKKEYDLLKYNIDEIDNINSVISDFIVFAEEKWKLAGDKSGSGNTANIGSIKNVNDLINGNGVFVKEKLTEKDFDTYWINYKREKILNDNNEYVLLSSLKDYIKNKK